MGLINKLGQIISKFFRLKSKLNTILKYRSTERKYNWSYLIFIRETQNQLNKLLTNDYDVNNLKEVQAIQTYHNLKLHQSPYILMDILATDCKN